MRARLKLIGLGVGIFVLAVLVAALAVREEAGVHSPLRSTYNTDGPGCKAFYELLSATETARPIRLRRFDDLDELRGVLIIVGPAAKAIDYRQARRIEKWVRSGNSLLYFVGVERMDRPPSVLENRFVAGWRHRVPWGRRGARKETAHVQGGFRAFGCAQSIVYRAQPVLPPVFHLVGVGLYEGRTMRPAVVWRPWGNGQVIVCASSSPIQNRSINKANNLEFLLCALQVLRQPGGRVIFDEFHQGFDRPVGVAELLSVKGMLAAAAQLAVCGLVYVWLQGRRMGPPVPLEAHPLRSAQDYLDAAGSLYRDCCRPGEIAAAYGSFALRTISRKLGLARNTDPKHLATLLAQRSHVRHASAPGETLSAAQIESLLVRAAGAPQVRLSSREAARLVKALDELMKDV